MKLLIILLRFFLRFFYIFPVKKEKVVLQSFNGRLFNCSPKYISEMLLQTGRYELFFAEKKGIHLDIPPNIRCVRYLSLAHIFHLMTAGFVIFNSSGFTGFLPYRKKQVIIQTWHGSYSFKVIGNDLTHDKKTVRRRQLSGSQITYFLSSSKLATKQHSRAMCVPPERFLEIGLPRNDVLFQDQTELRKKVFQKIGLDENIQLLLYAPTFRDGSIKSMSDYHLEPIDCGGVVSALEQRFGGKFVFAFKAHHNMIPSNIEESCLNLSDYTDIQELLCAASVIITDYSSCMADFAYQHRPGFLYAPDLEDYVSKHPISMETGHWPYPLAKNNSELIRLIEQYDQTTACKRIDDFFDLIENCENGHANEKLLQIMDHHLYGT